MSLKQKVIEEKASEILDENFLTDTILVPISHICRTEGISIREIDLASDYPEVAGILVSDSGRFEIRISTSIHKYEKRVTIARLLGRYILYKEDISKIKADEKIENEDDPRMCLFKWAKIDSKLNDADKLGLSIILPNKPFIRIWKENNKDFHRETIADTYCQVPISAFNYRLNMLGLSWKLV